MVIQSGHEAYRLVVGLLGEQHGDGWACPWCRQEGAYEVDDESTSDRLFVSSKEEPNRHFIRFVCRHALAGIASHHPVHDIEELFNEFADGITLAAGVTWSEVAAQFKSIVGVSAANSEVDPNKAFWTKLQVLQFHGNLHTYPEWAKVGFSPKTVDKLFLGVAPSGRLTIPVPHLVPDPIFGLYPDGNMVQRTRRAEGVEIGKKYLWPSGLSPSLWYIEGDASQPCRIFEGDTSTIAGVEIWPDSPAASMQGAGSWTLKASEYLLARGHTEFHIYSDNDKSGQKYETSILQAFRTVAEQRGTDWNTLKFSAVLWPEDAPEKYDPREVLKQYGVERAKVLLEQWLAPNGWYSHGQSVETGRVHAMWDKEYAESYYGEDVLREKAQLFELQDLRGTDDQPGLIYQEIKDYVENYTVDDEGQGTVFLVRSTPGVGKTRAAVRYAEDVAREYLTRRQKAVARRLESLYLQEQTDAVQAKIQALEAGHYKKLSVVFIGPYIDGFEDILNHASDPSLWYNCEARNSTNCQSFDMTQKVINAGYGIMQTCCIEGGICPVREACHGLVNGVQQYMAQLDELVEHPIVYLRHNHLYMKSLLSQAKVVIVDEDPSSIALNPTTLLLRELQQFDAYAMLEGEEASVVSYLWDAFVQLVAMYTLPNKWLCGSAVVRSMQVTQGSKTLHELAQYIMKYGLLDKITRWRPSNFESAPDGRIVQLLTLLVYDILRDQADWNGQIFIQNNAVTFYTMQPYAIDAKKPVVALDATGMAYKYQLCFNRAVMEFKAEVYPKHARTHVVTNTENTMNTLHKGLTRSAADTSLYGIRDSMTIALKNKPQNYEALYDLDKVPNVAMREAIRMAIGLVVRHGSLLVVTYKTARVFMETFIKEHFPDYYPYMGFGHFRALRGLNVFENMPAILVIGTFRVPVDVLKRDLIAFHKDDPELLDLKTIRVDEYYHGTPWRYSTLTVADSRSTVQEYIHELEAGEIQQVVGRIRAAVSDEEKHIYLMTARPAMPWTTYRGVGSDEWDAMVEYDPLKDPYFRSAQSASWWWFEAAQSMQWIQTFIDRYGRMPTAKQLREDTGQTDYMVRKMLDFWDQQQQNS